MPALLERVELAVRRREGTVFVGLYSALFRLAAHDPEYGAALEQTYNYSDGMGVVWALRRIGIPAEKLTTTDIVHDLCALAVQRHWKVLLYGGKPGAAKRAAEALLGNHPGLEILGFQHGYTELSPKTVIQLRPDVVFVGLGAPTQELWGLEVQREARGTAAVGCILTCGGLFDVLSGERRRAPRPIRHAGFEWLFRVILEPRRLWRRYLLGNAWFLRHVMFSRQGLSQGTGSLRDKRSMQR